MVSVFTTLSNPNYNYCSRKRDSSKSRAAFIADCYKTEKQD